MKEMTLEDKQRIDEMLQTYFPDEYYQEQREATIPLVAELLKEEKNKAIDECRRVIQSMHDISLNANYQFVYSLAIENLEKLKSQ